MQIPNRRLPTNMRDWGANPALQLPRSTFNMSRTDKSSFNSGRIIPFEVREVLPGDTWTVRVASFIRLATPIKPVLDNCRVTFHFWFCPNRQLWDNWERFMGAQDNPGDSTDFLVPQLVLNEGSSSITKQQADYFGIPVQNLASGQELRVNALPFRMYQRVYDYHYRDQDLQNSNPHPTGDGPDTSTQYGLKRRGKRHDYFTSAKPFQQKGDPVPLALGGTAPVIANPSGRAPEFTTLSGGASRGSFQIGNSGADNEGLTLSGASGAETTLMGWGANTGLIADLGAATSATVTLLRNSIAIQHILERDARGGTRYAEQLVSRFGVVDPALLVLQQPTYLGGGSVPVTVNPIPNTIPSPTDSPTAENVQGNLAAVATASGSGIGFTQSFTEHGWFMGLMMATADLTYQQGLERQWSKRERFDYYTPELAHISEQPVFSREIYADGSEDDNSVFGYNGAYDEYRFAISHVKDRFRSKPLDGTTLDVWHYCQNFESRPLLNDAFIQDRPPIDRTIAVKTEPEFLADLYLDMKAARIMPVTGVPGLTRI